jgi:FMN phosphatase YigB (HAD superfamily)
VIVDDVPSPGGQGPKAPESLTHPDLPLTPRCWWTPSIARPGSRRRDFVTPTWPEHARDTVEREATPLAYAWTWCPWWEVRPGIPEALHVAADAGLPMAVVSNTLCGAAHRDFLAAAGLSHLFAAEFYSDEAGPRKPNPRLAQRAADAIGVPIRDCWFVGDSVHRDIACARRAGTGAAILMRSPRTDREPPHPDLRPDVHIEDGHGLLALLHQSSGTAEGPSART